MPKDAYQVGFQIFVCGFKAFVIPMDCSPMTQSNTLCPNVFLVQHIHVVVHCPKQPTANKSPFMLDYFHPCKQKSQPKKHTLFKTAKHGNTVLTDSGNTFAGQSLYENSGSSNINCWKTLHLWLSPRIMYSCSIPKQSSCGNSANNQ